MRLKQAMKAKQAKKPYTAKDYNDELVLYGGEWMTRGAVIQDLEKLGVSLAEQTMYLIGLDRFMENIHRTIHREASPHEEQA